LGIEKVSEAFVVKTSISNSEVSRRCECGGRRIFDRIHRIFRMVRVEKVPS